MIYYYTYKITLTTGSLNGYYYYGQHKTSDLNDGYAGSGNILLNYYKKYGKIEGVTYNKEIIDFYSSIEELNEAEKQLIGNEWKTKGFCLNRAPGGTQYNYTNEIRKKMSDGKKGKAFHIPTEEEKKQSSERMKKNNPMKNPDIAKKVSEKLKGHKPKEKSEEARKKISERMKMNNPMKNKETAKKVSEKQKGKIMSKESREKISAANNGKVLSEETKRKISESCKNRKRNNKGQYIKE